MKSFATLGLFTLISALPTENHKRQLLGGTVAGLGQTVCDDPSIVTVFFLISYRLVVLPQVLEAH
jgi:hypothetical protein